MSIPSLVIPYLPVFARNAAYRIKASPLGYRLANGAFWSVSGAVASKGMMLVASIVVARMLTREVYGELGIIRSTVNMFVVFASFGMGMTATKYVAELRETDPGRAGRIMALSSLFTFGSGSIVAAILLFLAPWLALHSLNAPHLTTELRISAIILVISALNGAQTGALAGLEAFKECAMVNFWAGLASFPILVAGAYWGGLRGSVWALGGNIALSWLLSHMVLRKQAAKHNILLSTKGCLREMPVLWKYSLPAVLGSIMVMPVMWTCNAFLVNNSGGYGEMALFDAANQWRMAILLIPGMVCQIALPMLSSLSGLKDRKNYLKIFRVNLLFNAGVAFLSALPVACGALWIMRAYGMEFEQGRWVLICLAITSVPIALNNVVGHAIASKGHMWVGFFFNLLWAAAMISLSWIIVHNGYGAMGLALANLIAYLLHTVWQSIYAFRLIGKPAK